MALRTVSQNWVADEADPMASTASCHVKQFYQHIANSVTHTSYNEQRLQEICPPNFQLYILQLATFTSARSSTLYQLPSTSR